MSVFRITAVSIVGILLSAALTACAPTAPSATGLVKESGIELTIPGVTVLAPPGVAPIGTRLTLTQDDRALDQDAPYAVALGNSIRLEFEDGIQPVMPVTLTFEVSGSERDEGLVTSDAYALVSTSAVSQDTGLDIAEWNPELNTVTASVTHFSWFTPVLFDLDKVIRDAVSTFLIGQGIEFPEPDCVDSQPVIADVTYSTLSNEYVYICVTSNDAGGVDVAAYSNSPIPFAAAAQPSTSGTSNPGINLGNVLTTALYNAFAPHDAQPLMVAGGSVHFPFAAGRDPQSVSFLQKPDVLVLGILATVITLLMPKTISKTLLLDKLAGVECASDLIGAGSPEHSTAEAVGLLSKAFFSCAGTALEDASLAIRGVIAILTSASAFFVASIVGIINEFTGMDKFTISVENDRPVGPPRWASCAPENRPNSDAEGMPLAAWRTDRGVVTYCESGNGFYVEELYADQGFNPVFLYEWDITEATVCGSGSYTEFCFDRSDPQTMNVRDVYEGNNYEGTDKVLETWGSL